MNKTLITWLAIIVLVIVGLLIFRNSDNKQSQPNTEIGGQSAAPGVNTSTNTEVTPPVSSPTETAGTVKSFTVTGKPFSFTPTSMVVNKGDTVKITFVNEAGTHDFVLDEFNVKTKVLQGGQSETVEFVANKTGSFEYYCSVGTHRQMGMKGTLTVK
jgi:plastocyanin